MTKEKKHTIKNTILLFGILVILFGNSCQEKETPDLEELDIRQFSSVQDIEGNEYLTVKIGNTWWMVDNLRTSTFNNGMPIPEIKDDSTWSEINSPAFSWYNNDPIVDEFYGKLYNGFAAFCCQICPEGWKLPELTDINQLNEIRFKDMSSTGYQYIGWANEHTFNGGRRLSNGSFTKDIAFVNDTKTVYWKSLSTSLFGRSNSYSAIMMVDLASREFTVESYGVQDNNFGGYIKCIKK